MIFELCIPDLRIPQLPVKWKISLNISIRWRIFQQMRVGPSVARDRLITILRTNGEEKGKSPGSENRSGGKVKKRARMKIKKRAFSHKREEVYSQRPDTGRYLIFSNCGKECPFYFTPETNFWSALWFSYESFSQSSERIALAMCISSRNPNRY
jgi:hypothetical protein